MTSPTAQTLGRFVRIPVIDDDALGRDVEARFFGAPALDAGLAADGHEDEVGLHRGFASIFLSIEDRRAFDFFDLATEVEGDTLHAAAEDGRRFPVHEGHDLVEHFDNLDLRAEGGEEAGELDADDAAADDAEARGHFGDGEKAGGIHDQGVAPAAGDGRHDGNRARREDNMFSFVYFFANLDPARTDKAGFSLHDLDAELLLGEADGADELADDLGLPSLHGLPVVADIVGRDAEFGALEGVDVEFGRIEEGLRGDAADVEAGAPEGIFLREEDFFPFVRQAFRGEVAAGSAADDDDVVIFHLFLPLLT